MLGRAHAYDFANREALRKPKIWAVQAASAWLVEGSATCWNWVTHMKPESQTLSLPLGATI